MSASESTLLVLNYMVLAIWLGLKLNLCQLLGYQYCTGWQQLK
jgi:hypothetical protein